MAERTLTISSAGKTFSFTGWKVGWAVGPADLVPAVLMAKQFLTFVSGAPFQPAIASALRLPDAYFDELRDTLRAKRDRLCDGLREVGFDGVRPAGHLLRHRRRPTARLRRRRGVLPRPAARGAGVVAIPHQVFYDDVEAGRPLVRFAFCKRDEVLDEAVGAAAALTPGCRALAGIDARSVRRTVRRACTPAEAPCGRCRRAAGAAAAATRERPVQRPQRRRRDTATITLYCAPGTQTTAPRAQRGERLVDDLVGVEPEPVRGAPHVDAGPLVELGVGEARAQRQHPHTGAGEVAGQPLAEGW